MKPSFAVGFAVVAALGLSACTGPAMQDAPAASVDALGSIDPDYLVFDGHAAATEWFDGYKSKLVAVIGQDATALPENDPRTQRVAAIVARHWEGIRARFGVDLPMPQPLVAESRVKNAFVLYDVQQSKLPNTILVLTPMLELSDSELDAIMTHELGHLVLKHVVPGRKEAVLKHYEAGNNEPLGITMHDDPDVRADVTTFLREAQDVGPYPIPELADIPLGVVSLGAYLVAGAQRPEVSTDPSCQKLVRSWFGMHAVLQKGMRFDRSIQLTESHKLELAPLVEDVHASAAECLPNREGTDFLTALARLFAATTGVAEDSVRQRLVEWYGEDASVFENKDALTGLFDATTLLRERVHALMTAPSYERLRRYTSEEEADDFAMTILHRDGDDASMMGRAVLAMQAEQPRSECLKVLESGSVPRYGLDEEHHTECYRAFHSHSFTAWLARGGEGVGGFAPRVFVGRRAFDPQRDSILMD